MGKRVGFSTISLLTGVTNPTRFQVGVQRVSEQFGDKILTLQDVHAVRVRSTLSFLGVAVMRLP